MNNQKEKKKKEVHLTLKNSQPCEFNQLSHSSRHSLNHHARKRDHGLSREDEFNVIPGKTH